MELKEAVEITAEAIRYADGLDPVDEATSVLVDHARRSLDQPVGVAKQPAPTTEENAQRAAALMREVAQIQQTLHDLRTILGSLTDSSPVSVYWNRRLNTVWAQLQELL